MISHAWDRLVAPETLIIQGDPGPAQHPGVAVLPNLVQKLYHPLPRAWPLMEEPNFGISGNPNESGKGVTQHHQLSFDMVHLSLG